MGTYSNCYRTGCGHCGIIFVYFTLIMAFYGNSIASFPCVCTLPSVTRISSQSFILQSILTYIHIYIYIDTRKGSCIPVIRSISIDRSIGRRKLPSTKLVARRSKPCPHVRKTDLFVNNPSSLVLN